MSEWSPDEHLIPAALQGTQRMADLCEPDRAWVVAGLQIAGLTAEETADRLKCSLRLVHSVRALDMTMVCALLQRETSHFADELALALSEQRALARDLAESDAELGRVRGHFQRLLDAHMVGERVTTCRKCGAVLTETASFTTYVDSDGCRRCRECRAAYLRSRRAQPTHASQ